MLRTRNQDFVAPAPYHIPIEVVCVSEWESTSIERERLLDLVFGTADRVRDKQIRHRSVAKVSFLRKHTTCSGQRMSCSGCTCNIRKQDMNRRKSNLQTTKTESDTRGRPKVGRSACHRSLLSYDWSEFDKEIAVSRHQFVNFQQSTLISAGATPAKQRNKDRFNQLMTSTGTHIRPLHSSGSDFFSLQLVSHRHLSTFLLSSRHKSADQLTLFLLRAKDCFFSSVPKLTFLKLGLFCAFFLPLDSESPGKNKATCFETCDWAVFSVLSKDLPKWCVF